MLIGRSGLPHWYATLFVTTQVRNAGKAPNTMLAVLAAIRHLLAWAESLEIDIEARFENKKFLSVSEIESLRAYSQSHYESFTNDGRRIVPLPRREERARAAVSGSMPARVTSATQYIRMTYMADYLGWLAKQLSERASNGVDADTRSRIEEMVSHLQVRRPKKAARSRVQARQGLSEEAERNLLELIRADSVDNPFVPAVRRRNELIVLLLLHLGIRAGELLALKVSDFNFSNNTVVIARRHDDRADTRAFQPVVKTLDRRIPLSGSLSAAASDYVIHDRCSFRSAKRHEFLIVTHRPGPFQGNPLSMKGLSKVFKTIQHSDSCLTGVTPHVLRHTANDRLSALMEANKVSQSDEEKMRSYLMGWREGSGTAATYTRRYVERKAHQASLKLQEGWGRGDKHVKK